MPLRTVLVAVDGSETSLDAARAGLALLADDAPVLVVTVVETSDVTLVTGSGMAGGVMSAEELDELDAARLTEGEAVLAAAVAALDRTGTETLVRSSWARAAGAASSARCWGRSPTTWSATRTAR